MSELLPAANAAPSPDPAARRAQPPPAGPVLRVMCFNLRYGTADDGPDVWENRKDLAVRTIQRFDPDLLGVQEALRFQADVLRAALPDYGFAGAGRDDGRDAGEFCAVFYRQGRFERIDAGHFWLSESPDKPGSRGWDADLPRVCTWVKLRDLRAKGTNAAGAGGTLLFMNTHWDYAGKQARAQSARLTRATLAALRGEGPAILVGDFNGTEDDEPYAQLLHGRGEEAHGGFDLVDSYRDFHPHRMAAEATFHGFAGGREGSRIDWILHTKDLRTVDAGIDYYAEAGRYPSDHFPITAVLAPSSVQSHLRTVPSPGTPGEGQGEGAFLSFPNEKPSPPPSPGVPGEGGRSVPGSNAIALAPSNQREPAR